MVPREHMRARLIHTSCSHKRKGSSSYLKEQLPVYINWLKDETQRWFAVSRAAILSNLKERTDASFSRWIKGPKSSAMKRAWLEIFFFHILFITLMTEILESLRFSIIHKLLEQFRNASWGKSDLPRPSPFLLTRPRVMTAKEDVTRTKSKVSAWVTSRFALQRAIYFQINS